MQPINDTCGKLIVVGYVQFIYKILYVNAKTSTNGACLMQYGHLARLNKREYETQSNPLDTLSVSFEELGWSYERPEQNLIAFETSGGWCSYRIQVYRSLSRGLMYFSSRLSCKIPSQERSRLHELLCEINQRMCLGHFDLCPEDGTPTFRHTLPLSALQANSIEPIEDVLFTAIQECERFFPAIQLVIWGRKSPQEALESAILECQGSA